MKCTYFAYKFSDEIPLSRYDHILTLTEIGSSFLQSCISSMDVVKSLKGGMHDPASIFAQIRRLIRKVVRVRKIKIRKVKKRKSSSNLSHSLFYYFCQMVGHNSYSFKFLPKLCARQRFLNFLRIGSTLILTCT